VLFFHYRFALTSDIYISHAIHEQTTLLQRSVEEFADGESSARAGGRSYRCVRTRGVSCTVGVGLDIGRPTVHVHFIDEGKVGIVNSRANQLVLCLRLCHCCCIRLFC